MVGWYVCRYYLRSRKLKGKKKKREEKVPLQMHYLCFPKRYYEQLNQLWSHTRSISSTRIGEWLTIFDGTHFPPKSPVVTRKMKIWRSKMKDIFFFASSLTKKKYISPHFLLFFFLCQFVQFTNWQRGKIIWEISIFSVECRGGGGRGGDEWESPCSITVSRWETTFFPLNLTEYEHQFGFDTSSSGESHAK